MSAIDQYGYICLAIVHCPLSYQVHGTYPQIPVYRLEENIPSDEQDFQGKKGDILLGGGSGENAAMRIAVPEAFLFWTHDDWCDYESTDDIVKAFWTPTQAYVFGERYARLGWMPKETYVEWWLAHHILSFLIKNYPEIYQQYVGSVPLEADGSICRLPTKEELSCLHPPPYVVRRLEG